MKFTLGKQERLKSRKLIEKLYSEGHSVKRFPLRMVYLQTTHTSSFPVQMGVSVSKRNFKHAVDRNRLKRLMRETYRLQKDLVYNHVTQPYVFMISYIGKEELTFDEIFSKMTQLLNLFIKTTTPIEDEAP